MEFAADIVVAFAIGAAALTAHSAARLYTDAPVRSYDEKAFAKASALSAKTANALRLIKEARPADVDVKKALSLFTTGLPEGLYADEITVSPGRYTLKGHAAKSAVVDGFAENVRIAAGGRADLTRLSEKDGRYDFELTVTEKAAASPDKAKPAKVKAGRGGGRDA